MKAERTLVLVRHADAEPAGGGPDLERSLTPHGQQQARRVAENWINSGGEAALLISSPARRALQTAEFFARALQISGDEIRIEQALYWDDGTRSQLALIRDLPESGSSVCLFGHNPAFTELGALLSAGPSPSLPKGGLLALRLAAGRWTETGPGCARIVTFFRP